MKVLYSSYYSKNEVVKILESGCKISYAAQKFNKLFAEGFAWNDIDVDVIGFTSQHAYINENISEVINGRTVRYVKHKNIVGIFKGIDTIAFLKKQVKTYKKEYPDGIVIIDALSPNSYHLAKIAKKMRLKTVMIITDVLEPSSIKWSFSFKVMKQKLNVMRFYQQFKYVDLFVLLTESMTEKIKRKNLDYIVLNGVCDYSQKDEICKHDTDIREKRICMYTGEIRKMYGINNLVEAFLRVNNGRAELHLYGFGMEFYPDLQKIIAENDSVKYFGSLPNDQIVELQKKAAFLINPRLVSEFGDYVKYSFPSKNIEYMFSGRPMITTKLPCIGPEYNDYVYFFEDDSVEGMAKTLDKCLSLTDNEIDEKGKMASSFIFSNLNNKKNAKKILDKIRGF